MSVPNRHDYGAASKNHMSYLLILVKVTGSAYNFQGVSGLVSKHLFSCSIFLQYFLCVCDAASLMRGQTSTLSKFPLALCECISACLQQDLRLVFPGMLQF